MSPGKPPSESWDQLVDRALEEEAAGGKPPPAAAAPPPPRGRGRIAMLAAVATLSVAGWALQREEAEPTAEQLDQGRRAALLFTVSRVEAYLRMHRRLPERLDEVMPLDLRVTYRRSGDGAVLEVQRRDGSALRHVVRAEP